MHTEEPISEEGVAAKQPVAFTDKGGFTEDEAQWGPGVRLVMKGQSRIYFVIVSLRAGVNHGEH